MIHKKQHMAESGLGKEPVARVRKFELVITIVLFVSLGFYSREGFGCVLNKKKGRVLEMPLVAKRLQGDRVAERDVKSARSWKLVHARVALFALIDVLL